MGIGFSNIRLPNDSNSYTYKYDRRINIFPEEVFIHEFLHTLERILNESNYEIPALHDNELYGYKDESKIGLKNWYQAYMNCEIKDGENYIGLDEIVYTKKPMHASNFEHTIELQFDIDSNNFLVRLKMFFEKMVEEVQIIQEAIQEE